jgi:hypothetical protein
MKVIAVIEQEEVIYSSPELATKPDPGPPAPAGSRGWIAAPPRNAGPRELTYEPVYDLPVRLPVARRRQTGRTQTGALPWADPV